jgi:hypothetical protein
MQSSAQRARQLFVVLACLASADAMAKDVAGLFVGAFILSGALVGFVTGIASALAARLGFLRGAALAALASLIPWAGLLVYWDFPFPEKTLLGNLPFMMFVLIGTVPAYLLAFAFTWFLSYLATRGGEPH